MIPMHNGRRRRRRRGENRFIPIAILVGLAFGLVYVVRQLFEQPASTENLVLAAGLGIAAVAFVLTLPGTQALLDRRARERHDERQRRFWREREERERLQRIEQERKDAERAARRVRRRLEQQQADTERERATDEKAAAATQPLSRRR